MKKLLLTLFLVSLPFAVNAAEPTVAKQAYIVDFDTGQVLLAKNHDQKMPTSSMSKAMTMYMVFDAIENDIITLDTKFNVSEKAWKKGGSKMFVEYDKDIKVSELAQGVIVQSGNDATIVLAEGLSGSEERFASQMTAKAKELGMKNSNFVNASGWPDENHYSTAEDLAVMAKAIIKEFPQHLKYFSQREYTYNNITQQNRNPLIYHNIGADGLKTGHTEVAGYGLIGTAKQDDRRVVMVLNGMESEKQRAEEGVRLVSWALNNFTNIAPLSAKQIVAQADVVMGTQNQVGLYIDKDIKLTVPKGEKDKITFDVAYKSPLVAPIKAGDEIGTLTITIPTMEPQSYPVFANQNVEELGFFKKTWAKFVQFISGS